MGYGQVDELLVVGVLAGKGGLGGGLHAARTGIPPLNHTLGCDAVKLQAFLNLRIREHAHQFVVHGIGGQPLQGPRLQRGTQLGRSRIGKDEQVQHDVGVENDAAHIQFQ